LSERDQLDACAFYHQYYSSTEIDKTIIKTVYEIGEQNLGFSLEGIHPDDRWVEDIYGDQGWDYLDLFEMVNDLEHEFDVEIAEDDLKNIRTVDDLVRYLCPRVT